MAMAASTPSFGSSITIKKADFWEVSSSIPLNPTSKGGHHFLPSHLTPASRRRRVFLEVHSVESAFEGVATEDVYVRISNPHSNPVDTILDPVAFVASGTVKGAAKTVKGALNALNFVNDTAKKITGKVEDDNSVATGAVKGAAKTVKGSLNPLNIVNDSLKKIKSKEEDGDSDDESVIASFKHEASVADGESADVAQAYYEGWQPKYKVPLRAFDIVEKKKRSVIVKYGSMGRFSHREFSFDSEPAMLDFCAAIEKNKCMMADRFKARVEGALGEIKLKKDEELSLLIDICSGSQLPRSDVGKDSDPYITVSFNGKKIHKTEHIPNAKNPIWTLRKGSLFIWTVDALELFESEDGLVFEVKDYDMIGSHDSLGAFKVNAHTMYKWNGERREFALKPLLGHKDRGAEGKIYLRVRRATCDDIRFMKEYNENKNHKIVAVPNLMAKGEIIKNMMVIHSKKEKEGPDKGKTIYRIRPGPDPNCIEETSWLTKEKIEHETMRPSYEWTDIGSGHLGKVFVEVLSCDNLPNMDAVGAFDVKTGILGNKTDPFVSLVYEDCSARTDIIDDCLSPRWMPWSKRAFIFNCMHTSSPLFLAVFDRDQIPHVEHELIGRVTVDISNFQRGSTYLLEYKLSPDATLGQREAKLGSIKIRLRLELENERTLLLSNFCVPFSVYVNQETKKEFEVLRQTVEGRVNPNKFSLATINAHCGELLSYLTLFFLFGEAFMSLILWRGQSTISLPMPSYATPTFFKWIDVRFPLNSLALFVCLISLVENYALLPSFFFAAVGWVLLSTSELRTANPNPWMRCKGFSYLLMSLITGDSITGPHVIEVNEGEAVDTLTKHMRDAEDKAKKWYEKYVKDNEQYLKEMAEVGDTNEDLSAQTTADSAILKPTRVYLFPIQSILRVACNGLRIFKNILLWEECYISFWITLFSFGISVALFFVPWGFLIKWTLRIIAWVAFGPWMKLADMYYFSENDEQRHARMETLRLNRQKWLDQLKNDAMISREKTAKLRDFKQYLFGKYICNVNILKKDRYYDIPLPTSSATMYDPKSMSVGELAMQEAGYHRTHVDGQHLIGDMIPKSWESPPTEAPAGKPTKKTHLLDKGSSAAFYDGDDSYTAAAVKVGSIIVGSGAMTWYGVPLVVYLVRLVLPE